MKSIFTLFALSLLGFSTKAQVVLNEIYSDPGAGKNEFFELYNNSSSSVATSLQGYTLISYFEGAGAEKGFYVLDLPDVVLASKGYFVGSSAQPFNFQGIVNSTKSTFSWNDIVYLSANNGYLKKWVIGTATPAIIDGNSQYDEQPIPLNFNDLFYRRTGGGASYSVFIYRNGVLVNAFFGGENPNTIPPFISSMPVLTVGVLGVGDFNIDFSAIPNSSSEYVISDAGSDNGFIRNRDGLCGEWGKSSSQAQHTPNETNGAIEGVASSIEVLSTITRSSSATDSSTVTYRVLSAPSDVFPIILDVYIDNGTSIAQLDGTDTYIGSTTVTNESSTQYTQKFLPYDANILVTVKTTAGCYNNIFLTPNLSILPIRLLDFNGAVENNLVTLQWKISNNDKGTVFEVQKSVDGFRFITVGSLSATSKEGTEEYLFRQIPQTEIKAFYRLKMQGGDLSASYSKITQINNLAPLADKNIRLLNNPVDSYLAFIYQSKTTNPGEISIYSVTGAKLYSEQLRPRIGMNNVTINVGGIITKGIYVIEVKCGRERTTTKFVKK